MKKNSIFLTTLLLFLSPYSGFSGLSEASTAGSEHYSLVMPLEGFAVYDVTDQERSLFQPSDLCEVSEKPKKTYRFQPGVRELLTLVQKNKLPGDVKVLFYSFLPSETSKTIHLCFKKRGITTEAIEWTAVSTADAPTLPPIADLQKSLKTDSEHSAFFTNHTHADGTPLEEGWIHANADTPLWKQDHVKLAWITQALLQSIQEKKPFKAPSASVEHYEVDAWIAKGLDLFAQANPIEHVIHIDKTEKFHEALKIKGVLLLDFTAEWCHWCQVLAPQLDVLAKEFAGRMTIVSVDVDKVDSLHDQYNLEGLPTLILLKEGKEIGRIVGYEQIDVLRNHLNKLLH